MTTEQKCRQIAEALGWTNVHKNTYTASGLCGTNPKGIDHKHVDNFYTAAEASMGLLEAMHLPTIDRRLDGWHCHAYALPAKSEWHVIEPDLKTAIAEAFRASKGLKDE